MASTIYFSFNVSSHQHIRHPSHKETSSLSLNLGCVEVGQILIIFNFKVIWLVSNQCATFIQDGDDHGSTMVVTRSKFDLNLNNFAHLFSGLKKENKSWNRLPNLTLVQQDFSQLISFFLLSNPHRFIKSHNEQENN